MYIMLATSGGHDGVIPALPLFHRCAVIGATGNPFSARSIAACNISLIDNCDETSGTCNYHSDTARTHTHTYGYTYMHTHIHMHAHTHTHTFPLPCLSIVSTHPATAPGTVTLRACLAGIGLSNEKPQSLITDKSSCDEARPLVKRIAIAATHSTYTDLPLIPCTFLLAAS